MPGCEERPYIHYYGVHQPNLPYRVVCYTAAWIDILVPFALNVAGLVMGSITGVWKLKDMYTYGYYPLAVAAVVGTAPCSCRWGSQQRGPCRLAGWERE